MAADILWKDLIHIPETVHRAEFVVDLAGGVDRPADIVDTYVVTPSLVDAFRSGLELVDKAVKSKKSRASFLHGSFGSGKSHYMAMLYLLLKGDERARRRDELAPVIAEFDHLSQQRFLLVPYHMVGKESMEQGIFEGYVRRVRTLHPDAPLPGLYAAEGLFENARQLRNKIGDEQFFHLLNDADSSGEGNDDAWGSLNTAWDAERFERITQATPGGEEAAERDQLVGDLVQRIFPAVGEPGLARFVDIDHGLQVLSRHAKGLGYDGVVLFLDEIILWLASRAGSADFLNKEAPKLSKLVEAEHADRPIPIISFMARQRDLTEFVGEGTLGAEYAALNQALEFWKGRFGEIRLSDLDLPDIVHQRVLRPRDDAAATQIREGFRHFIARLRTDEKDVLQTADFDSAIFEKVFPFSPALINALVALSSALQRERTALRLLTQLLHRHRDALALGRVVPVGDLWEVVGEGEEPFSAALKAQFRAARRVWVNRLQPTIHAQHGTTVEAVEALRRKAPDALSEEETMLLGRIRNDERLAWTLLIAALVPEVSVLKDLTLRRLAALNHGAVHAPLRGQESRQVRTTLQLWMASVSEIQMDPGDDPRVRLNLTDVDLDNIISFAATYDNLTNRQKLVRAELAEMMGLSGGDDAWHIHTLNWRGGKREIRVQFANVRTKKLPELAGERERWTLVVDYPFDEHGHTTSDDTAKLSQFREERGEQALTIAWLPHFLTPRGQALLGKLVQVRWTLTRFEEAASALPPVDRPVARNQLEAHEQALTGQVRDMLRRAYHLTSEPLPTVDDEGETPVLDSLYSSHQPRVPGTTRFDEGLTQIAHDALAALYPHAPELPHRNFTRGQVQKLCSTLIEVFESAHASYDLVDRGIRELATEIVPALGLGELGESRLARHEGRLEEITRAAREVEQTTPLTVGHLRRILDPDEARSGLPPLLQDLMIVVWAAHSDYALSHGGIPVQDPQVGQLDDAMVLAPTSLPDKEAWQALEKRVGTFFGLVHPRVLNARAVHRLADQVRDKVSPQLKALEALPGALEAAAERVGMDRKSLRAGRRWTALESTRKLASAVSRADDDSTLLEAVARLECRPSETAVIHTLREAEETLKVLQADRWHGLNALAAQGDTTHPAMRAALVYLENPPYLGEGAPAALAKAQDAALEALQEVARTRPVQTPAPTPGDVAVDGPVRAEQEGVESAESDEAPAMARGGGVTRRERLTSAEALEALVPSLKRAIEAGGAVEVAWTEEDS